MSYCVNCGVELDATATKCALCDTAVFHPELSADANAAPPYSDKIVIPQATRRRFVAYIISMLMLIPNIVCVLANLFFDPGASWSFYVASTTAIVWVLVIFPLFAHKSRPYLIWGFDSLAVSAYTYFFFAMDNAEMWFLKCALPVIGVISLCSFIYILWYRRKKRGRILCVIMFFGDAVACSLAIGAELAYYYNSSFPLSVSLIVAASNLSLLVFLIYCNKSRRMNAWLSRNFFVE